jgi:hypothetical protein
MIIIYGGTCINLCNEKINKVNKVPGTCLHQPTDNYDSQVPVLIVHSHPQNSDVDDSRFEADISHGKNAALLRCYPIAFLQRMRNGRCGLENTKTI